MRIQAEQVMKDFCNKQNILFNLVKFLKKKGQDVNSGQSFVDLEKAFDRVQRRIMQWALGKKGLPKVLVKAVMSLYGISKTKLKLGSQFSKEFCVAVGVHQGSVLSPFCLRLRWML